MRDPSMWSFLAVLAVGTLRVVVQAGAIAAHHHHILAATITTTLNGDHRYRSKFRNGNLVQEDGDDSFAEALGHRELDTEYVEPLYWQRYRDQYDRRIKQCKFLANTPPPEGTSCQRMKTGDYTCLFGETTCPLTTAPELTHPTQTCDCDEPDRLWRCEAFDPCTPVILDTCPEVHPSTLPNPVQCSEEGLECIYGSQTCCSGTTFELVKCICAEGQFTWLNNFDCRFNTCPSETPVESPITTNLPTTTTTTAPSTAPTPTAGPTETITEAPTVLATLEPSERPRILTSAPTNESVVIELPSTTPSSEPSATLTSVPTMVPSTTSPTEQTETPTLITAKPSLPPSLSPEPTSAAPLTTAPTITTASPTTRTEQPSGSPTVRPFSTTRPSEEPVLPPTESPFPTPSPSQEPALTPTPPPIIGVITGILPTPKPSILASGIIDGVTLPPVPPPTPSPFLQVGVIGIQTLPPADQPDSCTDLQETVQLDTDLVLNYVIANGVLKAQLTLNAAAGWIGFGRTSTGGMVGGEVVIGQGSGSVEKFELVSKSSAGVVPVSQQTLEGASFGQSGGQMVLQYENILVEPQELAITPSQDDYIWAYGSSNQLGFHKAFGSVSLALIFCDA